MFWISEMRFWIYALLFDIHWILRLLNRFPSKLFVAFRTRLLKLVQLFKTKNSHIIKVKRNGIRQRNWAFPIYTQLTRNHIFAKSSKLIKIFGMIPYYWNLIILELWVNKYHAMNNHNWYSTVERYKLEQRE